MPLRAILLVNLGSPDSPTVPAVRRYLREFLGDERVLDLPAPARWLLLEGIILRTRPKASAHAYATVWTKEGSPLVGGVSRPSVNAWMNTSATPSAFACRRMP